MEIAEKQLKLVKLILNIDNIDLLSKVENMLYLDLKYSINKEFIPFTMDEYINIIKNAEDDIENNRVITLEDLKLEIEKW